MDSFRTLHRIGQLFWGGVHCSTYRLQTSTSCTRTHSCTRKRQARRKFRAVCARKHAHKSIRDESILLNCSCSCSSPSLPPPQGALTRITSHHGPYKMRNQNSSRNFHFFIRNMAQAELKTTWTTTLKSRAPMPLPLTLQKGTLDAKLKSMSWQIP